MTHTNTVGLATLQSAELAEPYSDANFVVAVVTVVTICKMKERLDSTKMLREPGVNGSGQDVGGVMKLDAADVKAEVKEEDGRKSGDSTPPSRKVPNGDTGMSEADFILVTNLFLWFYT